MRSSCCPVSCFPRRKSTKSRLRIANRCAQFQRARFRSKEMSLPPPPRFPASAPHSISIARMAAVRCSSAAVCRAAASSACSDSACSRADSSTSRPASCRNSAIRASSCSLFQSCWTPALFGRFAQSRFQARRLLAQRSHRFAMCRHARGHVGRLPLGLLRFRSPGASARASSCASLFAIESDPVFRAVEIQRRLAQQIVSLPQLCVELVSARAQAAPARIRARVPNALRALPPLPYRAANFPAAPLR